MIHRRGLFAAVLAGSLFAGTGCEDRAPIVHTTDEPEAAKKADPVPTGPTTQSLLEGPRKPLSLSLLPFTIEAPEGWKVVVKGDRERNRDLPSITMVEGPIINDIVGIRMFLRESVSSNILQLWIDKVPKEDAEYRKQGGSVTVRDVGDIRIIDRRRLPAAATRPSMGTASDTTPIDLPIEWRVTIFHPSGIKYDQYELSFFSLTPESFKQNEKLLDSILNTLKYSDAGMPPLP